MEKRIKYTVYLQPIKDNPYDNYKTPYESVNKAIRYLLNNRSGSHASITKLKNTVDQLAKFANKTPDELIQMEKEPLEKLIEDFLSQCKKNTTANSKKQTIKTFFQQNKKKNIEYPNFYAPSRKEIKILEITIEDAYKMAKVAPSSKIRTMIHLLTSTGLRVSTLLALRFNTIETENEMYHKYTILKELERNEKNLISHQ